MLASAGDFDRIDLAPFAQCPLGGLRFEIVPSLKNISSYYQSPEFPEAALLAEHVSDLIEVIRQKFARKIQRQRLAETEFPLVGNVDVFLLIVDVIGQFIVELFQIGKFSMLIDLARPPAEDRPILTEASAHCDEFESFEYFLKADGHGSAFSSNGNVDFRKPLFQRLRRLEQGDQSALAYRLDHQTIAVTVHHGLIARQFELHGNSDRLVAAIAEQSDVSMHCHSGARRNLPETYARMRPTERGLSFGRMVRRVPVKWPGPPRPSGR
jgi:hypothetical protein